MSRDSNIVTKKAVLSRISKRMEIGGKTAEFLRLEKFNRKPHNSMDYYFLLRYNLSINGGGRVLMESMVAECHMIEAR